MNRFDRVIIADWSSASGIAPRRPSADAVWLGLADTAGGQSQYHRTRHTAEAELGRAIAAAQASGERLLIGFDFPMGYPQGFAPRLTGAAQAQAVWRWLAHHITDDPGNRNNRFEVAAAINRHFGGAGPFWGRPPGMALRDLPPTKAVDYPALGLPERRAVETVVPRAQPVWKLYTTGAAGAQGLVGQPMIHRLRARPGVAVWPFDPPDAQVVLAEVYPSLLARAVRAEPGAIKDEAQVRLLSRALLALSARQGLSDLLDLPKDAPWREEGWILGAGKVALLESGLQ